MTAFTPPAAADSADRQNRPPRGLGWGNPLTWPAKYAHWLHLQWPGGSVEKLPHAQPDGSTNVPGLYVVGDLTGIPLLKLSANAGHDVVAMIADELKGEDRQDDVLDVAIIGGGTSGFSAAKEAERRGLRYCVFEVSRPFNTIKDFPKGKPIYTYPTDVEVSGDLDFHEKSGVKEGLVEDLEEQTTGAGLTWVKARTQQVERKGGLLEVVLAGEAEVPEGVDLGELGFVADGERVRAKRVIVGIGRAGNYRKLNVPGEDKSHKVAHRLHDPNDYCGQKILVVGGGDSAMESAIALAQCGAEVTLSYRKKEFSRPKPENQEKILALADNPEAEGSVEPSDHRQATGHGDWSRSPDQDAKGSIKLLMPSNVKEIKEDSVVIDADGDEKTIDNEQVFLMIGREAPLDFFRRSGVKIRNEKTPWFWATFVAFLVLCVWLYHWKGASGTGKPLFGIDGLYLPSWLLLDTKAIIGGLQQSLGGYFADPTTLGGTILASMQNRPFYYTFLYCACVVGFGIDRMVRRRTPYVYFQTVTLILIQCIPLFVLPEILLPYLGNNGLMSDGVGGWVNSTFFADENGNTGQWWRAYGLILAWPLMAWNWFTAGPIWGWVVLGFLQTFVLIPAMVYWLGKGSYCGWICSCGALAETLGDRHRHKMPHGVWPNRLNLIGQVLLVFGLLLQGLYILRWMGLGVAAKATEWLANTAPLISWSWFVDLLWAGVIGVGFYFWFSGRVWCRFACPLAALMHIYHRFGRFAILAEKKKCISCNVCTSVCHQGIDVMSFANKGRPMVDPQCVRCSACVQMCPTGVLSFGRIDRDGNESGRDPAWLAASPVRIREGSIGGDPGKIEEHQAGGANAAHAKSSKPVGLTVNGRRVRRKDRPGPLDALLARVGISSSA